MGYTRETYQKAQQALDARRAGAIRQAEERRTALHAALPELAELERSLASTGLAAVQAAISGGGRAPDLIAQLKEQNLALQKRRTELLTAAGLEPDFLDVHYTCPRCQDTGYIVEKQCDCMAELLRKAAYEQLGDCSGIRDCRFDNFLLDYYPTQPVGPYNIVPQRAMEKVLSICVDYARSFSLQSESLLLCGGTVLGKTHLSLAIAGAVIQRGFGVIYTTSHRLLGKLQEQQFSRNSTETDDYQSMALGCDLLIIDDLGAEFSTNFTVAALYGVINERINLRRPTVINTNFDETILRERYGDRILSRLLATYRPLQFYGEDIRMRKRFGR